MSFNMELQDSSGRLRELESGVGPSLFGISPTLCATPGHSEQESWAAGHLPKPPRSEPPQRAAEGVGGGVAAHMGVAPARRRAWPRVWAWLLRAAAWSGRAYARRIGAAARGEGRGRTRGQGHGRGSWAAARAA
jgi:hypothetical protein